jgi:putative heme-binding domain-containing protein
LSRSGWIRLPALRSIVEPFALLLALCLPAAGTATSGRAIFEGKGACVACLAIGERGGSLGPELSKIGVIRSPESLRLALVNPDAEIAPEYFTVVAVTKGGQTLRGITLNEDDLSIQIRDRDGNPRSFLKDDLKSLRRERRSMMPSYAGRLTAAEISDLVSYLRTLSGPPSQDWPTEASASSCLFEHRISGPHRERCRGASRYANHRSGNSCWCDGRGPGIGHGLLQLAPCASGWTWRQSLRG